MCSSTATSILIPTSCSVKDSLIRKLVRREAGAEAAGKRIDRPFAVMAYDFALAPRGAG